MNENAVTSRNRTLWTWCRSGGGWLCAGLLLGGVGWAAESSEVTTARLLEEMTDLSGLASFPRPAYTCKQFSSYDRASKSPQVEWFANGDAGHYLRVEETAGRQEHVLMDTAGPGAVVRIWSANPAGILRVYLDGAPEAVLTAPMTDLLGGKYPGLPKPLAGEYSKGWNLYFPIPYASRCKITSDQGGFYYHVNYRTYAAGTRVETFRAQQLEALAPRLERLAARLSEPRGPASELGGQVEDYALEVPPGESTQQGLTGPAAITRCMARVEAADLEAALRGAVVKMTFDGERCVEAPLGDFFGTAPGLNTYSTLPLGVTREGELYCHWLMPFRDTATIEVVNHSRQTVRLRGQLAVRDYAWTADSMHFHAKWRAQWEVPTRPMIDWNYLTAQGQGVFAGVAFAIDNPVKDWWGEGDEKIYVDGESFPSHFGTGTEDYFGYAWCWPGLFTHAYHAQPRCDGPGNYGRTSVNRFHILDRIPFTKDFRFDMELWHWNANCRVNMAVTAYWYAKPGGRDTFAAISPADAAVRPLTPYTPPRVAGALEGEALRILQVEGTATPQDWASLSNEQHLWWHAGMQVGDTLTVAFPVPQAGRYRVFARFLQARDYGIHQMTINGHPAGGPRDFYTADVTPTPEVELGTFDLKAGDNELSVTVKGANEKAVKAYMFGLDYLRLQAAP